MKKSTIGFLVKYQLKLGSKDMTQAKVGAAENIIKKLSFRLTMISIAKIILPECILIQMMKDLTFNLPSLQN